MEKLKKHWGIKSNWQLLVICIVFAITGSSSAYVTKLALNYLGVTPLKLNYLLYLLIYIISITPIYVVLLVFFGTVSGQFNFFWNFTKKFLIRLRLDFIVRLFEK
jgi:manganese efflux pump family protein